MDRDNFVHEIEKLLQENGAIKELQTKLRSDLIQILLHKKQPQVSKDISDFDKALNLLIIEHVMQKGFWYSASVMSSEAEFIEPPPEIETVLTGSSGSIKRYDPAKFRHSSIANILRSLNNPNLSSKMLEIEEKYLKNKNKSFLSLCLTSLEEEKQMFQAISDEKISLESKKDNEIEGDKFKYVVQK